MLTHGPHWAGAVLVVLQGATWGPGSAPVPHSTKMPFGATLVQRIVFRTEFGLSLPAGKKKNLWYRGKLLLKAFLVGVGSRQGRIPCGAELWSSGSWWAEGQGQRSVLSSSRVSQATQFLPGGGNPPVSAGAEDSWLWVTPALVRVSCGGKQGLGSQTPKLLSLGEVLQEELGFKGMQSSPEDRRRDV